MQNSSSLTRALAISVLHHALSTHTPPEFIALSQFGTPPAHDNDVRFIRSMVLSSFRHLSQIDNLLSHYITKPLPASKAWVQCAFRVGVVQMYFHDVPAHAAVNSTVEAVKQSKYKALSGMVNAVLKRVASDKPALGAAIHNVPTWLRESLMQTYGEVTIHEMAEIATGAPTYDVFAASPLAELPATSLNEATLRCSTSETAQAYMIAQPNSFVQDIAASYPVAMLGDIAGKHVLEIGAAPGGKTMQMLLTGAQVTALDRSEKRMVRLKENLEQRSLNARCIVADAMHYTPETPPDIVLLDAPCSATGTWRKHPEVLHLLCPETIQELAHIQRDLMDRAWGWLSVGGILAYSVCSLQPEEGESQLAAFLSRHNNARIMQPDTRLVHPQALSQDGSIRTHLAMLKEHGGMDGFFAVALEKI